ncbi:MAG: type IX secretion system sortase PorU [Tannerellaceae bacterium]|jgi:hypothetical protein|nr:type IX secretion system sortase PorU [Tannerellaceae bacterium]
MAKLVYAFIFFFGLVAGISSADRYAANSVLNEGKWVKIEISETGIYKLSYSDLRQMGFENPEKVGVYGYGGWPLNEDFAKEYIDDLPAVAVRKGSDYLLFYGRGVIRWEYSSSGEFVHTNNPYSTKGYYFLTDRDEVPKEMAGEASAGNGSGLQVTSFDDYVLHEREQISLNNSGRELFGESLARSSSLLSLNFPNVPGITNEDAYVRMRFVARATGSRGTATLLLNGMDFLNVNIETVGNTDTDSYTVARAGTSRAEWVGEKSEAIDMKVSYSNTSHANVHLDYVRLQMKRELKPYGAYTLFRSVNSVGNASRFIIQGADTQTEVWDVTDPQNAKVMETTLNGTVLSFSIDAGGLREFALVQTESTGFGVPVKTGDVSNQNLHGMGRTDMVIIALPFLQAQAERLAEAHRGRDGLTVEVVDPHTIYNEYSSGTPDASAYRRFMKMLYDKGIASDEKPRFLLLFGDGLYDNRGLCSKISNTYPASTIHQQLLLTYQSEESLNIRTYVTDDYFGLLRDYNNYTAETIANSPMDIAIGRLPLRTEAEARQAVDKIIGYMDNKQTGAWKNTLAFVADDGNNSESNKLIHTEQANALADEIESVHPEFLINKIYFDAYKKNFSGQATYPDVRNRIQQLLKSGLLLINYTGHGDTQSWSDEKVLTQTDIATASYANLPLWVTATCDFTRFDALAVSAGEQVFLNKSSGGIALFTTTRVVFSTDNFRLNRELNNHLFEKANGKRLTMGEIMQRTKTALPGNHNKLCFIMIGDPALCLAYPDYKIAVTSINGQPVTETATFRALEKVTVEGEVRDYSGNPASDYNGMLYPTVLDSKDTINTLDNNNTGRVLSFANYPGTLFVGNDRVENGKFSFSFTVPKDISYSGNTGKMNFYAYDETQGIEAQGAFSNYRVGGSVSNPDPDNEGPEIRSLYLNDSVFVSGDVVNSTPLFVAGLWDQSGVNITGSSIGHDVMLIIDGNSALSYNLNSYFETIPDSEGSGRVIFPVPELAEGLHSAELIVWDVHNNSSRETFSFVVAPGLKPQLTEVYATPNPAREQVDFRLVHNLPESLMHVEIRVFDMTGRLLWTGEQQGSSELFKDFILTWDLTDNTGTRLRPGIYVYRAAIKTKYSKEASKGNKLIILAQ